MINHTPGKWSARSVRVVGEDGVTICMVQAYPKGFAIRNANIARIVACVNYFGDYPTAAIEDINRIGGLEASTAGIVAISRMLKVAQEQRSALLNALEALVLFTDVKPSNAVALNAAYDAITAAKGSL